jgi:DNA-binding transcriptional regulator YiaG
MRTRLPLPRGWKRRVKSSIVHILALSHYSFTALLAQTSHRSRIPRLQADVDRLGHEIALLWEELRIKDARMARVPPHRRPHYDPLERMAILELRAARGWSAKQAAKRLLVTATTLGSWKKRIDEDGPNALLRTSEPVNRFPDLVRYIVRRLKLLCPRLGKVKIAEILCRAGLHLAPTTVGRFFREETIDPEPLESVVPPGRVVSAKQPDDLWHLDLTAVPTRLGFWTSWVPWALPQEWPFCWWVAVALDHFSRRVQGWMVSEGKPSSRTLRAFLGRTIRQVGRPRYLITDEAQEEYERQRARGSQSLSEEQRTRVLALATDFPAIWRDAKTPDRERKRMVRLLVEDVTLLRDQKITVHVRFKGGKNQSLSLPLPPCAWKIRQTPAKVVQEINRLLDHHTEREIATLLNRRGFTSGERRAFHPRIVQRIRREYKLKTRYQRLREAGMLSLAEMARLLGVSTATVKAWGREGLLQAHVHSDKNERLYEHPGETLPTKMQGRKLSSRRRFPEIIAIRSDEVQCEA